jgi:hypothetical protein
MDSSLTSSSSRQMKFFFFIDIMNPLIFELYIYIKHTCTWMKMSSFIFIRNHCFPYKVHSWPKNHTQKILPVDLNSSIPKTLLQLQASSHLIRWDLNIRSIRLERGIGKCLALLWCLILKQTHTQTYLFHMIFNTVEATKFFYINWEVFQ